MCAFAPPHPLLRQNERCMLRDCCVLLDGTELSPDTVVPPFTVFGGVPGRIVGELGETAPAKMIADAEECRRGCGRVTPPLLPCLAASVSIPVFHTI